MTNRKELVERRKHKRFQASPGAFAVLVIELHFVKLGQIIDISRGGLAFNYTGSNEWSSESSELGILFREPRFYLEKMPFKTISDSEIVSKATASSIPSRRRGVQFVKLTHDQKFELEHFIRNYTTGEVGV